jgi:hypothetical protein
MSEIDPLIEVEVYKKGMCGSYAVDEGHGRRGGVIIIASGLVNAAIRFAAPRWPHAHRAARSRPGPLAPARIAVLHLREETNRINSFAASSRAWWSRPVATRRVGPVCVLIELTQILNEKHRCGRRGSGW